MNSIIRTVKVAINGQTTELGNRHFDLRTQNKYNEKSFISDRNRGKNSAYLLKIVVMTTIFSIFGLFSINFATPVSALSLTLTVPSDALSLNIQSTSTFTKSSPSFISVKTDAFAGYSVRCLTW